MNLKKQHTRQRLGAIVHDLPRLLWSMRPSNKRAWVYMHNRDERIVRTHGLGVQCDWQWTSDLHIANVFPALGRALMHRALADRPIELKKNPDSEKASPAVSFVIGHRGTDRLPLLLTTLQSVAAQRDVSVECIVVEQSTLPEVQHQLPSWVNYIHTPLPFEGMPYSRAWAFNVGARRAAGQILVLHDNDILVSRDYSREIVRRVAAGYQILNLKRFIFYLSEEDSGKFLRSASSLSRIMPASIMQNALGGSIAVVRKSYTELGGFDESFVGWGGEDNEFWERCQTRKVWPFGYLPMVHLWHSKQDGKHDGERSTIQLYQERSTIPAPDRIAELAGRDFGNPKVPSTNVPVTKYSKVEALGLESQHID